MSWGKIADIAEAVNSQKTTATDNVKKALATVAEHDSYQAIIAPTEQRALERASQIDELIKTGKSGGRLAGVPFIAKDNFLCFGAATTAASNILKGFDAPYQATAIERLEAEGAICVAKANLDAFGHGSSTENSDFFTTKNPSDPSRVPGGSSGGSAAAVMLDIVPFSVATDTGGSLRLPASFCGAVGYKPTYGLVSRYGVIAMAASLDTIGPLTKTVEDAGLVLDVIAGKDPRDSTTVEKEGDYSNLNANLNGLKVGVIQEYLGEGIDEKVKSSILGSVEKLKAGGAEIVDISIPSLPLVLAAYYIICPAEISSNLSRYDGQRYGHYSKDATSLEESYSKVREEGFGTEAKRRIMIGTYVLSSGYYDAYYKKASLVRTKLINEFNEAFGKVDFLAGPVAPMTAFKIGENIDDPLKMYLIDLMTVAANLVGVPSISVPSEPADGMPVGLQLMAQRGQDKKLLEASLAFEEARK